MNYEITSLNDQGLGICFVDNKITFVSNTYVGDIVEVDIIKNTSKYNLASVKKYIKKIERTKSNCPYFDSCGGCIFLDNTYDKSLDFKKNKVKNILHKFANIDMDVDVISSPKIFNYRNKITLKIKNKKIGYYSYNTNTLVEIDSCLLASNSINLFIKELPKYNIENGEVVIRSNYNDELLVHIISNDNITIPNINLKIVGIIQNDKVLMGEEHFIDILDNKLFEVSYNSFFQVNRDVATLIFKYIKENILKDKNVLDLYCGVGTLGINVADISNNVYGIEIVQSAVLNAIKNAKINKCNNTKYMLGDASKIIDKIDDKIDVVILDPPRSGISKKEIDTILKMKVEQIIYVSCDPITLSRDLKLLSSDYKIVKIKCFDMFSYTFHVESLCILERKKI